MLRRLVGVAALTAALLVGATVPAMADDVALAAATTSGSTWPAWRQSTRSRMGPTSGRA